MEQLEARATTPVPVVDVGPTEPSASGVEAAVLLRGVSKLFDANPALVRVSLTVPAGGVVWLRGPNGSGKSTLLRVVATALAPTYGSGSVLGFDLIEERAAIRERVELLGHRTRLYGELTAVENLRFACVLHGIDPERVPAALRAVGLAAVSRDRVSGFSQGMRQRLALARCWLRRPELLLLDEPYAGLDDAAREVVDELCAQTRAHGGTVLLASHDPPPRELLDSTIELDGGALAATP